MITTTKSDVCVYVAASDAPLNMRNNADYVCDGVADQVEIQLAINSLTLFDKGGKVCLSPGTFVSSAPIICKSKVSICGSGEWSTIIRAVDGSKHTVFDVECSFVDTGKASGGSNTSIVDTKKSWAKDALSNKYLIMYGGTGAGQCTKIISNDANSMVIDPVQISPDDTTWYRIVGGGAHGITISDLTISQTNTPYYNKITSSSAFTCTQSRYKWGKDELSGKFCTIVSGSGAGQVRRIASNDSNTFTVYQPWSVQPSADDYFCIGSTGVGWLENSPSFVTINNVELIVYGVPIICNGMARLLNSRVITINYSFGIMLVNEGCVEVIGKPTIGRTMVSGCYGNGSRYGLVCVGREKSGVVITGNIITGTDYPSAGVTLNGAVGVTITGNYFDALDTITTTASGKVSSATENTLLDSSQSWVNDAHVTKVAEILSGTGAGQRRRIVSNTNNQLTVRPNWNVVPDTTSCYRIVSRTLACVRIQSGSKGIVISGNTFRLDQNGALYGVWNQSGHGINVCGNTFVGDITDGFVPIVDDCGGVVETGNISCVV